MNSAYIIHTPGNDLVTDIILQVIERNLPQKKSNLLQLITDRKQQPIKSLESMQILFGNSRFGNSLGAWSAYADSTIDISPLGAIEDHTTVYKNDSKAPTETEMEKLKRIANLRFKGSEDGIIKSEQLFTEPFILQRRKKRKRPFSIYDHDNKDDSETIIHKNEFSSIAPLQYAEFELKEKLDAFADNNDNSNDAQEHYTSITLKLSGPDVFAGLHELSVMVTNEEKMVVNPVKMPSWLTGEEGQSCGIVKDGKFSKL
ncbi:chromosome loss- protein [Yamadazyma tenuis]|nr:chromosome loss- protein [Yamadazyma tenuis]